MPVRQVVRQWTLTPPFGSSNLSRATRAEKLNKLIYQRIEVTANLPDGRLTRLSKEWQYIPVGYRRRPTEPNRWVVQRVVHEL